MRSLVAALICLAFAACAGQPPPAPDRYPPTDLVIASSADNEVFYLAIGQTALIMSPNVSVDDWDRVALTVTKRYTSATLLTAIAVGMGQVSWRLSTSCQPGACALSLGNTIRIYVVSDLMTRAGLPVDDSAWGRLIHGHVGQRFLVSDKVLETGCIWSDLSSHDPNVLTPIQLRAMIPGGVQRMFEAHEAGRTWVDGISENGSVCTSSNGEPIGRFTFDIKS